TRCFGGREGQAVHHLAGGGQHTGGDDGADRLSTRVHGGVSGQQGDDPGRVTGQVHGDASGHPQGALGADEGADEVVTGGIGRLAPEVDRLPGRKDDLQTTYVVDGEAVLEAVGSTGVLRDVASDRADLLAGGVGRVVVAVGCGGVGDVEVGHPGFDHGALVLGVDLDDPTHPGGHEEHTPGVGEGAGREAGACATGDEGDPGGGTEPDDLGDLFCGGRQHDDAGHRTVVGEAVTFVGATAGEVGEDPVLSTDGPELGDQGGHGRGGCVLFLGHGRLPCCDRSVLCFTLLWVWSRTVRRFGLTAQ